MVRTGFRAGTFPKLRVQLASGETGLGAAGGNGGSWGLNLLPIGILEEWLYGEAILNFSTGTIAKGLLASNVNSSFFKHPILIDANLPIPPSISYNAEDMNWNPNLKNKSKKNRTKLQANTHQI